MKKRSQRITIFMTLLMGIILWNGVLASAKDEVEIASKIIRTFPLGITLDNTSCVTDIKKENDTTFHIELIAGRPRLPKLVSPEATTIVQAILPDKAQTGEAQVIKGGITYTFLFTKKLVNESDTVVLQYDDYYQFPENEVYSVESNSYIKVSSSGLVRVIKAGGEVTVTTESGKTYVVKTIKAPINIVMAVGQSIASGKGGTASQAPLIKPGTGYNSGYAWSSSSLTFGEAGFKPLKNTNNDGTAMAGVFHQFTIDWYNLTGEKNVYINAAKSGITLEQWQVGNIIWEQAMKKYYEVVEYINRGEGSSNYELNRTFYYFNHGSADASLEEEIYEYYVRNVVANLRTVGFQFGTVFECYNVTASMPRKVHEKVIDDNKDLYLGTYLYDQLTGMLNEDGLHPTQQGYNFIATKLAYGTYNQVLCGAAPPERKVEASQLTIEVANQTYAGTKVTPQVTVSYKGNQLAENIDYTVSFSNNISIGTATVTVKGIGDTYFGTGTKEFEILPANITNATISKLKTYAYTGKSIKPTLSILLNKKKLKKKKDYTVTYYDTVKAGTATAIVEGIGNYEGTVCLTYKIRPRKVIGLSLKQKKGKVTIRYKKRAEATGYQIQYKKKGASKYRVLKAITKTSYSTKKLKKNTIYYVRVRSYKLSDGKRIYSLYSSAKKIKVKK